MAVPTWTSWWLWILGADSFAPRSINLAVHCCFPLSPEKDYTGCFCPPFPASVSLRTPSIWWSCSAPSSRAPRNPSGTATRRASSPTRRLSLRRTTRRWRPTGTEAQPSPCAWPSPPRKQRPCPPLSPSAAHRRASPSPARTWPSTSARSSGTRSIRSSSGPWPHRDAPPVRSGGWRRCAPSPPSARLRVQRPGLRQTRARAWIASKPSEPWSAIWEASPKHRRAREINWRRAKGSWTVRRADEAALEETELQVAASPETQWRIPRGDN